MTGRIATNKLGFLVWRWECQFGPGGNAFAIAEGTGFSRRSAERAAHRWAKRNGVTLTRRYPDAEAVA